MGYDSTLRLSRGTEGEGTIESILGAYNCLFGAILIIAFRVCHNPVRQIFADWDRDTTQTAGFSRQVL
jgi:hypothetical protein